MKWDFEPFSRLTPPRRTGRRHFPCLSPRLARLSFHIDTGNVDVSLVNLNHAYPTPS
ncbi:hypothetical protein ES703_23147 [subsurface metagenome]